MMDSITRKEKLTELQSNQNNVVMTGIPLRYRGETQTKDVYKIPLDYLVYNKYNGRIGTEVLSYEKQNSDLNPEINDDKKIIEGFLYNSKVERNKTTMHSLKKDGQQRYGIVTADGIIVDGNRRAMLLNKLYCEREKLNFAYKEVEHCQYFFAVVLPDDAAERDIQQLETIYQMGEDDKLDYNPIEKYLKCKELGKLGFSEEDIAGFMNESKEKIKEWISILKLMEEYLDEYDYDGIYTRLEKTEGPFVDLVGYLDSYKKRKANVRNVDWVYNDTDISDLQTVCFDYIRARYEGKEFREIAKTGKEGSIFFHEDLWKAFLEAHAEKIPKDEESVQELREQHPGENLSMLLKTRDNEWINRVKGKLKGNLKKFSGKIEDKRAANKPVELLDRALSALQAIDYSQENFKNDSQIEEKVKEISKITWDMKKHLDRR